MRCRLVGALLSLAVLISTAEVTFCQAPPTPPTQLDEIAATTKETKQTVDSLKQQSWIRDWGPVITAFLTAAVAIYSLRSNLKTTKELADQTRETTKELARQNLDLATRGLKEKVREEERKAIRDKIDQFYGPFLLIRGTSNNLYKIFRARRKPDEIEAYKSPRGNFAVLIALVKGWRPTGPDEELLKQIIALGHQTSELIRTRIGLVDDQVLQSLLWRAFDSLGDRQQIITCFCLDGLDGDVVLG